MMDRLCGGVWAVAFELDGRLMHMARISCYAICLLRCAGRDYLICIRFPPVVECCSPNPSLAYILAFLVNGANGYNRA